MKQQPLPAITICIPALLSIAKLSNSSKLNENSKQILKDYMKYVEQSKTANKTTWTTLENDLVDLYYNVSDETLFKGINFEELAESSITSYLIKIKVEGEDESFLNKSYLVHSDDIRSDNYFLVNDEPIGSFARMKCFTYFSVLQEYWKTVHSVSQMIINIENDFTQYYPVMTAYRIALHSPNILPRFSVLDYLEIRPSSGYWVEYSQLSVELLLEGFESNCAEYDIGNEYGTIRMENDYLLCLLHCRNLIQNFIGSLIVI